MYVNSVPPVPGDVFRWQFRSGQEEANGVTSTCVRLIQTGFEPDDIFILLSNSRTLARPIEAALTAAKVPFEPVNSTAFRDTDAGRFILTCLRVVCNEDDYVALRVLLGALPGVGIGTCNKIAVQAILNNLNYKALFHGPLPSGVFDNRSVTALDRVRTICGQLSSYQSDDPLSQRATSISTLLLNIFGQGYKQEFDAMVQSLPADITLREFRDVLSATTDAQIASVMETVYKRLELPIPKQGFVARRVQIMTMHGAKGLDAKIVLVPGLEDEIFPGPRRQPYPGLVLEGARLLYVSITRARVACFLSYAAQRVINGSNRSEHASRYVAHTGGGFSNYGAGLNAQQAKSIYTAAQNL